MTHEPAILATGAYLPSRRVSSTELVERVIMPGRRALPGALLERQLGVRERRYATDTEYSSTLAIHAGADALARAGLPASELDLILCASASYDFPEPATANVIQEGLGARCRVLDVRNACMSALDALDIAAEFVRTGRASAVLVAAGEKLSPFIKFDLSGELEVMPWLSGLTLGDAGAAWVVGRRRPGAGRLLAAKFCSEGTGWSDAMIEAGGTRAPREVPAMYFRSDSPKLYERAQRLLPGLISEVLDAAGWHLGQIDWVVPHQVSPRLVSHLAQSTGVHIDRCVQTLQEFGNTAAASIPLALHWLAEKQGSGLLGRVLLVGGGAGFSAGAVAVEFK